MSVNKFIISAILMAQVACATIIKSERTMVQFNGGLSNGETKIDIPDGQYSTKNGMVSILVTRSKEDIPIAVTCNQVQINGVIQTKYDPLAGFVGSLLLGGLIGVGIDAVGNKTYDPPRSYNISSLCSNNNIQTTNTELDSNKLEKRTPSSNRK